MAGRARARVGEARNRGGQVNDVAVRVVRATGELAVRKVAVVKPTPGRRDAAWVASKSKDARRSASC